MAAVNRTWVDFQSDAPSRWLLFIYFEARGALAPEKLEAIYFLKLGDLIYPVNPNEVKLNGRKRYESTVKEGFRIYQ